MSAEFIRAGSLNDIKPGQLIRADIPGQKILLANVAGEIFAIAEMCTHEEFSLFMGALEDEYVSCSLHGSRFSVKTGEPQEEPACVPLQTYPVKIEGEDILVAVD